MRRVLVRIALLVILLLAAGLAFVAFAPKKLIATAVPEAKTGFLIAGARVFDGETDLGVQDVLLRGEKIEAVGAPGTLAAEDVERIDATGKTLLPGFIDSHGHLESNGDAMWDVGLPDLDLIAQGYLHAGVTTVLVLQAYDDQFDFARRAQAGDTAAPRLLLTGPRLTAPEGFPIPLYRKLVPWPLINLVLKPIRTAATPEEAIREVDDAVARFHPRFYKITSDDLPLGTPKLGPEVVRAAVQRAHEQKMRVAAHIGHPNDLMIAAEAGVDLFAHPPSGALLTDEQIARLLELKVPFVSTQQFLDAPVRLGAEGPTASERKMVRARALEAFARPPKDFEPPGAKDVDTFKAEVSRLQDNVRENLRRLLAAGAQVFVGTDAGSPGVFPGASMHRELREVVKAGMTPAQALRAATSAPAAFLDQEGAYGRVAPGRVGDLVLIDGNPLEDIALVERVSEVFQAGRKLKRSP